MPSFTKFYFDSLLIPRHTLGSVHIAAIKIYSTRATVEYTSFYFIMVKYDGKPNGLQFK